MSQAERRAIPGEIGLYGLGYYTQAIIDLCRAAGIRIAFVVDDQPESRPGFSAASTCLRTLREALGKQRVPVWTESKLFRSVEEKVGLPVLVAARIESRASDSVSSDPYLRTARLVREISAGSCQLLHPVTLAHALPRPAYRKRVALFGSPGSGNILARHLLAEVYERIDDPVPPAVGAVAACAEHYYYSTLVLVRHLLRHLRPVQLELTGVEFPTVDLTLALPNGEYAVAMYLPSNRHLGSYLYHSHAIPTRMAIDEMTRLGAPSVAIIRHPCETILSWASKVSRPATPLLDSDRFFSKTVQDLAEWHHQLIANEGRVLVLRYEDLVARQRQPVRMLAQHLGVHLSETEIDALYDRHLNRDLLPELRPGHFYHGGNDKWKKVFLARHVRQLVAQGFGAICARWGYDLTLPEEGAPVPRGVGGPSGQMNGVIPLGKQFALKDESFTSAPFPMRVLSNSKEVSQAIRDVLYGPDFLEHLDAGGLGLEPPAWVPPVSWPTLARIFPSTLFPPDGSEPGTAAA